MTNCFGLFSPRYLFLFISYFNFTFRFSTLISYLHLCIMQQGKLPLFLAAICFFSVFSPYGGIIFHFFVIQTLSKPNLCNIVEYFYRPSILRHLIRRFVLQMFICLVLINKVKPYTLPLFFEPFMAIKNKAMPTYALSLRSNAVGSTDGCLPQAKTVSFGNKIKVNVNPSVFLA